MRKITTSEVIKRWLKDRFDLGKFEVSTHMLELQLPEYGKMYYGVLHTPSTYSRDWRKLKANVKQLALFHHNPDHNDNDIKIIEKDAQKIFPNTIAAREGLEILLPA